jgi:hypothetical protein
MESGTYSASSAYKLQFLGLVLSNMNTLIWKAWATPKAKKSCLACDEGMTPRFSIFAYLVLAKEEARSKDTRSPQGPALRLGVEGKNSL